MNREAEHEAKRKPEKEVNRQAEDEAKRKPEEEANREAEHEDKRKPEEENREAEHEAKGKPEEVNREAEDEVIRKTEREVNAEVEHEAKRERAVEEAPAGEVLEKAAQEMAAKPLREESGAWQDDVRMDCAAGLNKPEEVHDEIQPAAAEDDGDRKSGEVIGASQASGQSWRATAEDGCERHQESAAASGRWVPGTTWAGSGRSSECLGRPRIRDNEEAVDDGSRRTAEGRVRCVGGLWRRGAVGTVDLKQCGSLIPSELEDEVAKDVQPLAAGQSGSGCWTRHPEHEQQPGELQEAEGAADGGVMNLHGQPIGLSEVAGCEDRRGPGRMSVSQREAEV